MKRLVTDLHRNTDIQHAQVVSAVFALALAEFISSIAHPNCAFAAERAYRFEVITAIGSAAPGGGAFVSDFEPSALNNRGQLAFTSEPAVPGEEAIFLAGDETIRQIMRFGQSAPGGSTFSLFELGTIGLNNEGDLAFAFTLEPFDFSFSEPLHSGVFRWAHRTGKLSPVVIPNVTPDPNGGVFLGANFDVSLNNRGDVAFTGYVGGTPTGPGQGFFVQSRSGRISTVARTGDLSPDGGTFILASPNVGCGMNDAGDVAFQGNSTMDPPGNNSKLYLRRAATDRIELVVPPAEVVRYGSIALNNHAEIAYGGHYLAHGQGGVYSWKRGQSRLLAKVGDPAPGGGTFQFITGAGFTGHIALNNEGDVAFEAATTLPDGTIDEAVYYYSAETQTLQRLVGIGAVIPGYGTVVSLEQVGALVAPGVPVTGVPFSYMTLNDRGQLAFAATVNDGVTVYGVLLLGTPEHEREETAADHE
jgi:hypothetical protein